MARRNPSAPFALGDRIAAAIPHHTLLDWMNEGVMPDIGEGRGALCPRCARRLPCTAGQQAGQEGVWIRLSSRELIAGCLVDGPRAARAMPLGAADVIAATEVIALTARRQGWKATGRLLERALALEGSLERRVQICAQALEATRSFGLFSIVTARTTRDDHPDVFDAAVGAQRDLDVLVVSSGPHWPTSGPR